MPKPPSPQKLLQDLEVELSNHPDALVTTLPTATVQRAVKILRSSNLENPPPSPREKQLERALRQLHTELQSARQQDDSQLAVAVERLAATTRIFMQNLESE